MNSLPLKLSRLQGKIIAIDGPAGAGKSTTAKLLAERLNYVYLDTGAMYRALTWFALENGIEPSDGARLTQVATRVPLEFKPTDGINRVFFNGVDVTEQIRTPEVTLHVSEVAAHPGVREAMVARQRQISEKGSVVAEGRDTTTVVFPKADFKIYLDASVRERAQRRLLELTGKGFTTTLEDQEADIRRRDEYDSNRAHSPLTRAKDALVVDTTNLSIDEQVDRILSLILNSLKSS